MMDIETSYAVTSEVLGNKYTESASKSFIMANKFLPSFIEKELIDRGFVIYNSKFYYKFGAHAHDHEFGGKLISPHGIQKNFVHTDGSFVKIFFPHKKRPFLYAGVLMYKDLPPTFNNQAFCIDVKGNIGKPKDFRELKSFVVNVK